jgi:HSP20 family protein
MTLVRLSKDYNNRLNHFGSFNPWMNSWIRNFDTELAHSGQPQTNIIETEKTFEIEMAVPGFSKSEIQIKVDNSILTIFHENGKKEKEDDRRVIRQEFVKGEFSRSFRLSRWVDHENITARFENGVLRVEILKKEEALPKPVREIKIS